ncbi:MAG: hypothetical protein GY839_05930 [candidate division Zixibacteria bacterium]|nr:hypothetical protein [candidate division Zixibacteria bacterium]
MKLLSSKLSRSISFILLIILISTVFLYSRTAIDDATHVTDIGNISMTITNYGVYGTAFRIEDQASCEYPIGSHIEHLWMGGLWFGGEQNGQRKVSTGAIDAYPDAAASEGFEFTTRDTGSVIYQIEERSSLTSSQFFHPEAISHQDFICDFSDSSIYVIDESGEQIQIPEHDPFGIDIHQETYSWSLPFADAFVIFSFDITNKSEFPIENIWIGYWYEPTIGNTDLTPYSGPDRSWSFYDDPCNMIDTMAMGYSFDRDGDDGFAESYIGCRVLGSTPAFYDTTDGRILYAGPDAFKYNIWKWRNQQDPLFSTPASDGQRYIRLSTGLNDVPIWPEEAFVSSNWTQMVSTGPYPTLLPDSTMQIVFAIVCAEKYGPDPMSEDTPLAKTNLINNASWAKIAYDGEDKNSNGILDPDEDLEGPNGEPPNGVIDRYILPSAPPPPMMRLVASDKAVDIYWNNSPESYVDPVIGVEDFEGYKIYRARMTQDNQGQGLRDLFQLIGQFDRVDSIGFNTGLEFVRLPEPVEIDGHLMHYKLTNSDLLNGWQYIYAVTAFDTGDPNNNLESLESSPLLNYIRVFPGPPPDPVADVGVFPNPYRAFSGWDGRGNDGPKERERMIHFYNLPDKCTIIIYTLAGEIVDHIYHDAATYSGGDIAWYGSFAGDGSVFSGGMHSWDVVSEADQALATGMYLYTVRNEVSGDIQKGKFVVIK